MSPSRRNRSTADESGESADATDPEYSNAAEAVRAGELSAAQLPGGHGNVDPTNPDAQYPPGVIDNRAPAGETVDAAATVPERRSTPSGLTTTAATPEYGGTGGEQ